MDEPTAAQKAAAIEAALTTLLAAMTDMKDEDRMTIFTRLRDRFCNQCGSDAGWRCNCMHDE